MVWMPAQLICCAAFRVIRVFRGQYRAVIRGIRVIRGCLGRIDSEKRE